MKKTISTIALAISSVIFAQCNILGSSTIEINKVEKYNVDTLGQCQECYHWASTNSSILLETNKQQSITVKALIEGTSIINASIMTPKGVVECSKAIVIKSNIQEIQPKEAMVEAPNCDVDTNDFKDLQFDETKVSFIPNGSSHYLYTWKVTYANGESLESNERTPQFQIIKNNDIISSQVKIQTKFCYKTLTRTYPPNYWAPPIELRIPQRIYEHVSYSDYIKKD